MLVITECYNVFCSLIKTNRIMKNKFKKQDAKGKQLSETIGKGIDEIHTKKVLEARNLFVGVRVSSMQKEMFIASCKELGLNQSDVLNLAIIETILKASKI